MKRSLLSVFFMIAISFLATAQQCGTVDVQNSLYLKNPELKAQHDSIESVTQNRIRQKYPWAQQTQGAFPAIPGFVESGNVEVDVRNYGLAKEALFKKDPNEFYRLTRKTTGQKR